MGHTDASSVTDGVLDIFEYVSEELLENNDRHQKSLLLCPS